MCGDPENKWFIHFTQGPPYPAKKIKFWDNLSRLGSNLEGPWLIVGDFNKVFKKNEKWGGKKFIARKAKHGLNLMENLKMIDLG